MAVYGYTRVSTTTQAEDGESLGVQQRQIEGYALQHGLTVDALYVESGVSGSVPFNKRAEGAALWSKLKAGDHIICPKLDRLSRSALDSLQIVAECKKLGLHLHLLDLGGDVMSNGLSRMFLTVAAAFAEAERDRIRERVIQTKADQRARGRYLGGKIPFGMKVLDNSVMVNGKMVIDKALIEDEDQQVIVADIVRLRATGLSLRKIAAEISATHGVVVCHTTVDEVLKAA